jgi:ribosome-associated heat shock protein Hsp15
VTIALHGRVLVLKVLAPGRRRGPVTEARALYEVLAPRPGSSLGDTPARARRTA